MGCKVKTARLILWGDSVTEAFTSDIIKLWMPSDNFAYCCLSDELTRCLFEWWNIRGVICKQMLTIRMMMVVMYNG